MAIIDHIRMYFGNEKSVKSKTDQPKGTCPNCWGKTEWDGKFYDLIKDKHAKPGSAVYDSFISEVVNDHVLKTHHLKDKYICTNCNQEIPE